MSYRSEFDGDVLNRFGPRLVFGIIGLVMLIALATSSATIVQPGNRGILVTLGQVSPQFKSEGLHFKFPIIQKIESISIRQRTQKGRAPTFSKDLQSVKVEFDALYRVPENKVVELFQGYSGVIYDSLLEPRIQEQMKQVCAQYRAEDLVQNREKVKTEVIERMRKAIDGLIILEDLTISNIELTNELQASIEQKQIAEQEAQKMVYVKQQAELQAEVRIIGAEAEAKAARVIGETLRQNPQVIEMEIARKWDGKAPQTVVTGSGGSNVLLPLR
ncbi:MAG: prohibitin family protein [Candidatus Methylacidiphilales bacterium]